MISSENGEGSLANEADNSEQVGDMGQAENSDEQVQAASAEGTEEQKAASGEATETDEKEKKGKSPRSDSPRGGKEKSGARKGDADAIRNFLSQVDLTGFEPLHLDLKALLHAGAHYGHQAQRWNPKMMPYIFGEKNRVHIINLDLTLQMWQRARKFVLDIASRGGNILIVGTKTQARSIIEEEASRCGAYYVTSRWLGGTLSNFETIKRSIERMRKLEKLLSDAESEDSEVRLRKKEKLAISRELEKLEANLGGIREMRKHPDLIFVVDINKESIAVAEARKLHIPVVALVDTNTDPEEVDFPIASNDDAIRTIKLFTQALADAVLEGRREYLTRLPKDSDLDVQSGKGSRRRRSKKSGAKSEGSQALESPESGSEDVSESASNSAEGASVG